MPEPASTEPAAARPAAAPRARGLGVRVRAPLLAAAALVSLLAAGDAARAESFVRNALLGDEIEATLEGGDLHVYRVPLTAGTRLDLDLRAEADGDGKDDDDGTAVTATLVLRAPDGTEFRRGSGPRVRTEATIPSTGTWQVEVSSDSAADYDLHVEGEPGRGEDGGRTTVAVSSGTVPVHLDVPRGALVRIEVRRRSGGTPRIAGLRDGLDRPLDPVTRKSSRSRVRLHAVPVPAVGGLSVDVGSADGGAGTYEVRTKIEDAGDDGPGGTHQEREDRKIVLTLAPGADPLAVVAALGPGYELEEVHEGFIVVETPEGREGFEDDDAVAADVDSDDVLAGEANVLLQTPEGSPSNGVIVGSDLGRSAFDAQPSLSQVRAAPAHGLATGAGVVVAVLDGGFDATHPVLAGRLLPGRDFVDGDADPSEFADGIDQDLDGTVDEGYGHGTFVAGLVLAAAPDARILPVRVLDSDARGTVARISAAISWAVENGADVVNLSLEMPVRSAVLGDAVRLAMARGVVVVGAAGNGGLVTGPTFPATVHGVVAVTATDALGRPAPFGNGGPGTTVGAPGVDLVGPYPGDRYGTWSGTSFATALASGGAALAIERRPGSVPAQVVQRFVDSARPAPRGLPAARRRLLGAGRLDLLGLAR